MIKIFQFIKSKNSNRLIPQGLIDECQKKILALELNKVNMETVVIGSSHACFGYLPSKTDFNLSFASQDLYYSYKMYEKYCNIKNLKNVVLFYSVFSPGFELEKCSENYRCAIYKVICGIDYKSKVNLKKIEKEVKHYRNKNITVDEDYYGQAIYSQESYGIFTDVEKRVIGHIKHNTRNNNQFQYLEKLIDLIKKRQQNLYIVIPPFRSDYKSYCPDFNVMFKDVLNLQIGEHLLNFYNDNDFKDEHFGNCDHLNKQGAELLTKKIKTVVDKG